MTNERDREVQMSQIIEDALLSGDFDSLARELSDDAFLAFYQAEFITIYLEALRKTDDLSVVEKLKESTIEILSTASSPPEAAMQAVKTRALMRWHGIIQDMDEDNSKGLSRVDSVSMIVPFLIDQDGQLGIGYTVRGLLENRLVAIVSQRLPLMNDVDDIYDLYSRVPLGKAKRLIDERMAEVLLGTLPGIDDIDQLQELLAKCPKISDTVQEISKDGIVDLPYVSLTWQLVEDRMIDVLSKMTVETMREHLPNITDGELLCRCWHELAADANERKSIEDRIFELLSYLSTENLPGWFMHMMADDSGAIPEVCRPAFSEKLKEIFPELA